VVEQLFRKQQVLGSNPSVGSSDPNLKPGPVAGFRDSAPSSIGRAVDRLLERAFSDAVPLSMLAACERE
jgi:hypothetical protein